MAIRCAVVIMPELPTLLVQKINVSTILLLLRDQLSLTISATLVLKGHL